MKYLSLLLGILVLASVAFAVPQECMAQEATCLQSCCSSAGGINVATDPINVECQNPTDAASASFFACANSQCRPATITCAVPSGTCTQQFQSCVASCSDNSCKDNCYIAAGSCINQYEAQPLPDGNNYPPSSDESCCGSAFVLLGVLSFAFIKGEN